MSFKSICQIVGSGFLIVGLTACIANPTKDNKEGMERIENKVAFFLDCPKESLTMSCLNYSEKMIRFVLSMAFKVVITKLFTRRLVLLGL